MPDDYTIPEHFPNPGTKPPEWEPLSFERRHLEFWLKLDRLAGNAGQYQHLIAAMSAYNDFQSYFFFNYKVPHVTECTSVHRVMWRRWAMRMYLVSLEDTLDLIARIASNRFFSDVMQHERVKESFAKVKPLLTGQAQKEKRKRLITDARNAAGAHVDKRGLIADAIKKRASSPVQNLGRVQISTMPFGTRFWIADDVMATMVVEGVWGLSGEVEDVDKELDWLFERTKEIGHFLGEFCFQTIHLHHLL